MADRVTRTIRVQAYIKEHTINSVMSSKKDAYTRFREISNLTYRAMNDAMTANLMVDKLRSFTVDIQKKTKEEPETKNEKWDFDHPHFMDQNGKNEEFDQKFSEMFGCKSSNSSYRYLSSLYGEKVPTSVIVNLSNISFNKYQQERKEVAKGIRTLSTYKKDFPVPISLDNIHIEEDKEKKEFNIFWTLKKTSKYKETMVFTPIFGKNIAYYQDFIKIAEGTLPIGKVINIQIKDSKLFLILSIKDPVSTHAPNKDISVGVDLGLKIPAYCAVSTSHEKLAIGDIQDFLRVRTTLQNHRRRMSSNLIMVKGGKGRGKKLQALDRFTEKERNFVKQYNHMVSKRIVDFAIKNDAGVIKLEFLKGFSRDQRNSFILRNWSYFQLQQQIIYKAKNANIEVVFIDPYHTSQTCSVCGNYEEGQRTTQSSFTCKKCNASLNADYNAAKNIANSSKVVDKEEDCQYYKLRVEETVK